jgi:hypothetical protein
MWIYIGDILYFSHPSACTTYLSKGYSLIPRYLDLSYGPPSIPYFLPYTVPGRAHDFHQDLYLGRSIGILAPPDLARTSVGPGADRTPRPGTGSPAFVTNILPGTSTSDRGEPPARHKPPARLRGLSEPDRHMELPTRRNLLPVQVMSRRDWFSSSGCSTPRL